MRFLGVLTIAVLATASGLPKPVYADSGVPSSPPGNVAQARRTPVLFTLVVIESRSVMTSVSGFKSWEDCKSAGLTIKTRFDDDGYTVDFVCVPMGKGG